MCRILYVLNSATLGGADQSAVDMLKIVSQRNIYSVAIIPEHGLIETKLNEIGIKYYIVEFENAYSRVGTCTKEMEDKNFQNNFYAAMQIQEIIKTEKINLIHINSSVSNIGAFAALLADIPYVWHFREFLEEDFRCEFWDKDLKKELVFRASKVIAISDAVAASYKQKYGFDMIRVYNGIDSERYKIEIDDSRFDLTLNNFIITGAITENKGQWEAIKAFHCLIKEGIKNIHLTVLGGGTERFIWILKQYIYKNNLDSYIDVVSFQTDLSKYRENSQYAITTSKMEALGRCTIEAMFAGNIVIGADTGGTEEIIGRDKLRGFLYEQGNYQNLANVIKKVIYMSEKEKNMYRINAQKYVEEEFSLDTYVERLNDIYMDVVQKHIPLTKEREKFVGGLFERYHNICNKLNIKNDDNKVNSYEEIITGWNELMNRGYKLCDYFRKYGYQKVAVYGVGNLGFRICREIMDSEIEIEYVVDKNPHYINEIFKVLHPEEEFLNVDLFIVALAEEEKEIVYKYKSKYDFPIVGVSEIVNELKKENSV